MQHTDICKDGQRVSSSYTKRTTTQKWSQNIQNTSSDDIIWSVRGRNQAVELVSRFSLFFADGTLIAFTKFQVLPVTLATACTACCCCLRVNQSISNIPYRSPCVHMCICGCVSAPVVHVITSVFAMFAHLGTELLIFKEETMRLRQKELQSELKHRPACHDSSRTTMIRRATPGWSSTLVPVTLHDMASPHSGQTRHRSLLVLLLCKTENFPWPSCSLGVFVIKTNQAPGSFNSWINTRSLLAWCPFSQLATPNEENHFSSRKLDPLYSVRNYL